MSKIVIKKLKERLEIENFAKGYYDSFSGRKLKPLHKIPVDDALLYDLVRGVYLDDKLVGGYLLNHYPTRCLESLDQKKQEIIVGKLGGVKNTSELAAIWKSKEISSKQFEKAWTMMIIDFLGMNKKYIFGCCYKGNKMLQHYTLLNPTIVHEGVHDNDLSIFYYTKSQYAATILFRKFNSSKYRLKKSFSEMLELASRRSI